MYENIIVIPFRDRGKHLLYFIENTVPLFMKYLPSTLVVVVEQTKGKPFNRGMLLNIAFKEYKNKTKFFFTHDVDINPVKEVIETVYAKPDIDVYRIKSGHALSLGGIVKLKHDTVYNINGFPNNIWGWGIEDRALFYRCSIKNVTIQGGYDNGNLFVMLPHASNLCNYTGEKDVISKTWLHEHVSSLDKEEQLKLISFSGIDNVEYKVIRRVFIHEIVEIIRVDI